MRFLIVFALLVFVQPAFADDEFGARFNSQATAGFEDVTTDPAKALSEIMPAAGEETEPTTSESEPASASQADTKPEDAQTQVDDLR